MLANMACSLIEHKRINTTLAKAKALKKFVEPLITKSKSDTTHNRRIVFSRMKQKNAVAELFRDVAVKVADRPGGYTRIIRLGNRLGDNAEMAMIELVDYNDTYVNKKKKTTRRSRRGNKKAEETNNDVLDAATDETPVTDETPTVLHYQCDIHPNMGNAVQVNSNKVDTPYQIDGLSGANITGVVTATSFSGTSASFSGNVSIGGTLTYEDVTNIDSVGLITARSGINATGVVTATSFVKSGGTSAQYLMADGSTTEGDSLTKGYIAGLTAFLN